MQRRYLSCGCHVARPIRSRRNTVCISGLHRAANVPLHLAIHRDKARRPKEREREWERGRERETPIIIVIIVVILCSADIRPSGALHARSRLASNRRLLTNKLCHNGLISVAMRAVGMLCICVRKGKKKKSDVF